jgi:hypothetical protein
MEASRVARHPKPVSIRAIWLGHIGEVQRVDEALVRLASDVLTFFLSYFCRFVAVNPLTLFCV